LATHCSSMAGSFYTNQKLFILRKPKAIILLKRQKLNKIIDRVDFLENQYLIYRRWSSTPMVSRPIYLSSASK
jgi:hypothetical protein